MLLGDYDSVRVIRGDTTKNASVVDGRGQDPSSDAPWSEQKKKSECEEVVWTKIEGRPKIPAEALVVRQSLEH